MKFLIICSYFPPDSAISTTRPFMFAKYLSKMGHKVTVLRSGEFDSLPDDNYGKLENVEVISYLGRDCEAEKFNRGEYVQQKRNIKNYGFLSGLVSIIRPIYHLLRAPFLDWQRLKNAKRKFQYQKKVIDNLPTKYDIVLSTYGDLENVFAGEYATKHLNAKWIMDFRDPIVDHLNIGRFVWNFYARRIQKCAISKANLCTAVSQGLADELLLCYRDTQIEVLYNGYDGDCHDKKCIKSSEKKLHICYTGQIYAHRLEALECLTKAISNLLSEKCVNRTDIIFSYAGPHSVCVKELFSKYALQDILRDYGFVSRTQAMAIQDEADVFLVLSWNSDNNKGVLTGKFYEGIRAKKPILAIVQCNVPQSELLGLNLRYNYGFCYEAYGRNKDGSALEDYLHKLIKQKRDSGYVDYNPSPVLSQIFRYDYIVKKLNEYAVNLCEKKNGYVPK